MKRNEIVATSVLILLVVLLLVNAIYSEKKGSDQVIIKANQGDKTDSFQKLSPLYVTDGKSVYYRSPISSQNFGVIKGELVHDTHSVYWGIERLMLNPKKVKTILDDRESPVAVYDDYYLYFLNYSNKAILVKDAATSTFAFVGGSYARYAKDKNRVYYINYNYENTTVDVLKDAEPQTFQDLDACIAIEKYSARYAKDSRNVYVENKIVPEADAKTFSVLGSFSGGDEIPMSYSYAKDKDTIFYNCGNILKEADYATFEYLGNGKAQDKNNTYHLGEFNAFIQKRQ